MGLIIPGCVDIAPFDCFQHIWWRFCGGVFVGDKDSLVEFYRIFFDVYENVTGVSGLTWEVNVWAYLELLTLIHPTWKYADHNDSILRVIDL